MYGFRESKSGHVHPARVYKILALNAPFLTRHVCVELPCYQRSQRVTDIRQAHVYEIVLVWYILRTYIREHAMIVIRFFTPNNRLVVRHPHAIPHGEIFITNRLHLGVFILAELLGVEVHVHLAHDHAARGDHTARLLVPTKAKQVGILVLLCHAYVHT